MATGRGDDCLVGAAFLTATGGAGAGGCFYYEVEMLEARGHLYVGFAGTNLAPQCARVGDDTCSWGFYSSDGDGWHGCARGGVGVVPGC